MSASKTLIELATGFAAGDYTATQLQEILGDDDIVSNVISLAGGVGASGIAAGVTSSILDTEIMTDVTDTTDEILDDIGDVLEDINPFNW